MPAVLMPMYVLVQLPGIRNGPVSSIAMGAAVAGAAAAAEAATAAVAAAACVWSVCVYVRCPLFHSLCSKGKVRLAM